MERLRKKEKGQDEDNITDVCGQDFYMGKKIETCLTPNHLLFGRQLLYYFNTTSMVPDSSPVPAMRSDELSAVITWLMPKYLRSSWK